MGQMNRNTASNLKRFFVSNLCDRRNRVQGRLNVRARGDRFCCAGRCCNRRLLGNKLAADWRIGDVRPKRINRVFRLLHCKVLNLGNKTLKKHRTCYSANERKRDFSLGTLKYLIKMNTEETKDHPCGTWHLY